MIASSDTDVTYSRKTILIYIGVVLCAVVMRLFLFLYYEQKTRFLDPAHYIALAHDIAELKFDLYHGERPPVYPLIIVLMNYKEGLVWLFQAISGIFVSFFLLHSLHVLTKSILAGAIASLG